MKVVIHAVGRMKAGPEMELANRYLDRFGKAGPALGLDFGGLTEIVESRLPDADDRRRDEAGRLSPLLDGRAALILLDERGRDLSSADFAMRLGLLRDDGLKTVVFAIGGPDGHDAVLRSRADLVWCFGALTWPHQLARIMLAEQLYRAATILAGHPYHRA